MEQCARSAHLAFTLHESIVEIGVVVMGQARCNASGAIASWKTTWCLRTMPAPLDGFIPIKEHPESSRLSTTSLAPARSPTHVGLHFHWCCFSLGVAVCHLSAGERDRQRLLERRCRVQGCFTFSLSTPPFALLQRSHGQAGTSSRTPAVVLHHRRRLAGSPACGATAGGLGGRRLRGPRNGSRWTCAQWLENK